MGCVDIYCKQPNNTCDLIDLIKSGYTKIDWDLLTCINDTIAKEEIVNDTDSEIIQQAGFSLVSYEINKYFVDKPKKFSVS